MRVNTDELHNGIDQFFQWMAVDPLKGSVYVQFYDRREDPENRKTRMVLARSVDDGVSFTNYAWGEGQFEGRPQGDYTWLTALNNRVYGAWSEPESSAGTPPPAGGRGGAGSSPSVVRVGLAEFK